MPRTRKWLPMTLIAAGAFLAHGASAQTASPEIIASKGDGAIVACATCHGSDGAGTGTFPRLAGLNAEYMRRQLEDFTNGRRENAVMQPIAEALGEEGWVAMSNYFADMAVAAASGPVPGEDGSVGARIALRGAWNRQVPACVQCHGPGGIGVGEDFPAIAGQPAGYIVAQLKAWREGTRSNDPLELMRHLAAELSDEEVEQVADWFARQSPVPAGGTQ